MSILDPEFQDWLRTSYIPIMGGAPEEGEEKEPETEDTPPADSSEEGTPAPNEGENSDEDFETRYKDVQAAYTQSQQELADKTELTDALRSDDPELRNWALEQLGYEVPSEEEGDDGELTDDDRITALEEAGADREQTQRDDELQKAEINYIDREFDKLEKAEGRQFSDSQLNTVARLSLSMRDKDGLPDVKAAHKALQDATEEEYKRRVDSKKAPQVSSGTSGEVELDRSSPEARQKRMAEVLASGG